MRVLIELLDKDPIENVLGACIFEPDIVVFLCDARDSSFFKESAIYNLFRRRKMKTRPRFYYFDATNPAKIRRVLAAVVRDYPGCVFDYTGGKDLVLLQAGAFCMPLGIPGYYVDVTAGRFLDIQHCQQLAQGFAMPTFRAEDIFALTGAAILGSGHYEGRELQSEGFEKDIYSTWRVVQHNPKAWGDFVAYLQACCGGTSATTLEITAPHVVKSGRFPSKSNPVIFRNLYQNGVLRYYEEKDNTVCFAFKSALHKKCLLNQGVWLELYCYLMAKESGLFSDVRTSVLIDWAGAGGINDSTKNEVDVMLVKGILPVFISCKMSVPTPLALSEIRVLSAKFGGVLSRTALVTADILGTEHRALRTRAEDLGILLLDRTALENGTLVHQLDNMINVHQFPSSQRAADAHDRTN